MKCLILKLIIKNQNHVKNEQKISHCGIGRYHGSSCERSFPNAVRMERAFGAISHDR